MPDLKKIFDTDLLDLITLFNGLDNLKRVLSSDPEAKNKLEEKLKGEYRFKSDSKQIHNFNFLITDLFRESDDGDVYIYFKVNLIVPGLKKEDYETFGKWVDSYAEDMRGDINIPSLGDRRVYSSIRISHINGVKVNIPDTHFISADTPVVQDSDVNHILLTLNEEISRIRKLII